MRLILFALFLVGAVALAGTLLAWLAERRLDRMAEAWSFADVARVPSVDVALVLGTAPIGPEGGPNRYFVYRLDAAAALWKAGKAKYFIVSGSGQEPTAMRAGLSSAACRPRRSISIPRAIAPGIRCCARATSTGRSGS